MITLFIYLLLALWGLILIQAARLAVRRKSGGLRFKEIPKTEQSLACASLAVASQDEAPKGLGCAGYKPLMRNLKGPADARADMELPATLLESAVPPPQSVNLRGGKFSAAPVLNLSEWRNKSLNRECSRCAEYLVSAGNKNQLYRTVQSEILCLAHLLSLSKTLRKI